MASLRDLLNSGMPPKEINALLSQSTVGTEGFRQDGIMGGDPYMPPQPLPQNYVQVGNRAPIDLGPSQPAGPALDYSSPIEMGGVGKGYRLKGDSTRAFINGQMVSMGRDTGAERARMKEDLLIAKQRQELDNSGIENQLKRAQLDQMTRGGQGIPKLEKGEVWNAEAGRVDAAPGSSRFITQQGKFAADKRALDSVAMKTQGAVDKVDEILGPGGSAGPGDGFKSNFGGYNAYLTQYLPGEASDKRKKIDSLKSDLRAAGLEMMRSGGSIGAMTEREWPIVEQMMAGISPVLSETEAAFQLAKVKTKMQQIRSSAQEDYDTSWRNTQFGAQGTAASPAAPGATIKRDLSPQDAQALAWAAGNPGDPRAAQINAKLGVK
jgi:hypothetical protein